MGVELNLTNPKALLTDISGKLLHHVTRHHARGPGDAISAFVPFILCWIWKNRRRCMRLETLI